MNCALWFDRCRINSAAEIAEHFDIAALRGYFLGGSLAEWLRDHGGEDLADKVERLDPADPELNQHLAEIFGQKPVEKRVFTGNGTAAVCSGRGSFSGRFSGSFSHGSGMTGSFGGSAKAMAGSGGSFLSGSFSKFRMWEWEWEWRLGGSFSGSYRITGSFAGGSFGFGSYVFGSGAYLLGSFSGSGVHGVGSFSGTQYMSAEEYDSIMYECLRRCPLNCFGYGIHVI